MEKQENIKTCRCCKRVLPETEFYLCPSLGNKRLARCKACCRQKATERHRSKAGKAAFKKWWENGGKEKRGEWQKEDRKRPARKAKDLAYAKTEAGVASRKKYQQTEHGRKTRREGQRLRMKDPDRQEKMRKYFRKWNKTEKAKKRTKRYASSSKGKDYKKAKDRRYKASPLGLESAKRSNTKRKRLKANGRCTLTLMEWEEIKKRYGHHCVYCGKIFKRLTQDHVVPLSKGGEHMKENILPACRSCNAKKGTKLIPAPFRDQLLGT